MRNPNWTIDEYILGLNFYLHHGMDAMQKDDERIIELSKVLQSLPLYPEHERDVTFRNPAGVVRTLLCFGALDESVKCHYQLYAARNRDLVWRCFSRKKEYVARIAETIIHAAQLPMMICKSNEAQSYFQGIVLYSLRTKLEKEEKERRGAASECCELCKGQEGQELHYLGDIGLWTPDTSISERDFIWVCQECRQNIFTLFNIN